MEDHDLRLSEMAYHGEGTLLKLSETEEVVDVCRSERGVGSREGKQGHRDCPPCVNPGRTRRAL